MSEIANCPNDAWDEAAAALGRLDRLARQADDASAFYDEVMKSVQATLNARCVTLSLCERDGDSNLAVGGEPSSFNETSPETRVWAVLVIDATISLRLTAEMELPPEAAPRELAVEFLDSVLEICAYVFLADQFRVNRRANATCVDDALVARLYVTGDVTTVGHSICCAVSDQTQADRVDLFRVVQGKAYLMTTSTQPQVEHRSRQVRQLETLATAVARRNAEVQFSVGEAPPLDDELGTTILAYLDESGGRQLVVSPVSSVVGGEVEAIVALERFRLTDTAGLVRMPAAFQSIRPLVATAVGVLMRQPEAGPRQLARWWHSVSRSRRLLASIAAVAAVTLAWWIPFPFRIPVQGVIRPSQQQRVFAPIGGTVAAMPVADGETVLAGTTIAVIHSAEVQLRYETVAGELAVADAELASLRASKSRTTADHRTARSDNASSEEFVLRTRVDSLTGQMRLLEEVRRSLVLTSKIGGRVSRWDQQGDLIGRNVAQGQLLLDIVASTSGHYAELELPDTDYGYLTQQPRGFSTQPTRPECSLRLLSDPEWSYSGNVEDVADSVHLNDRGEGVVRVMVPISAAGDQELPLGATVRGAIDCGKRPLGFVLFRPVIEWLRSHGW